MLTFNHCVYNSLRGATFGVTDGTSLFANGVLTLRGSFQQKKIFNASGNVTIKGPRGLASAQQDYCRESKLPPPPPPQDHFWQGQTTFGNEMWFGETGFGLDHLLHDKTTSTLSLVNIH